MSEFGPTDPMEQEPAATVEEEPKEPTAEDYLKAIEPLKGLFDEESWASVVEEFQVPDGLDDAVNNLHNEAEGQGIHEQLAQALLEAGLFEEETGADSPGPIQ